jgi:excisionase family DNA binding protein
MENMYLTLAQAAEYLKLCKSTLYKKTSLREIPFCKPGGKLILFLKKDLEEYLSKNWFQTKLAIEKMAEDNIYKKRGGEYEKK